MVRVTDQLVNEHLLWGSVDSGVTFPDTGPPPNDFLTNSRGDFIVRIDGSVDFNDRVGGGDTRFIGTESKFKNAVAISDEMTMEVWVRDFIPPAPGSDSYFFGRLNGSGNIDWGSFVDTAGNITFRIQGNFPSSFGVESDVSFFVGAGLKHIVITKVTGSIICYVDGVQVDIDTTSDAATQAFGGRMRNGYELSLFSAPGQARQAITIGYGAWTYSKALSPAEVTQNFNEGPPTNGMVIDNPPVIDPISDPVGVVHGVTHNFDADVTDDIGVTKVDYYLNNILADTQTVPFSGDTYRFPWLPVGGLYYLLIEATDTGGNTSNVFTDEWEVTGGPAVQFELPPVRSDTEFGDRVPLYTKTRIASGAATSITQIEILIDGSPVATINQTLSNAFGVYRIWGYSWEPVSDGTYAVSFRATDNLAATFTSDSVNITVAVASAVRFTDLNLRDDYQNVVLDEDANNTSGAGYFIQFPPGTTAATTNLPVFINFNGAGTGFGSGVESTIGKLIAEALPKQTHAGIQNGMINISIQVSNASQARNWVSNYLDDLVTNIITKFASFIDLQKIYLTGFSSGGGTILGYNENYPNKYAALVICAGDEDPATVDYANFANMFTTWFAHDMDGQVSPAFGQTFTDGVNLLNGTPDLHQMTYFDGYTGVPLNHDITDRVYMDSDLYAKLLTHELEDPFVPDQPPTTVVTVQALATVGEMVPITAEAAAFNNETIAQVQFSVNGIPAGTDSVAPYATNWTAIEGSNFVVQAIAMDSAGNTGGDPVPPTITVIAGNPLVFEPNVLSVQASAVPAEFVFNNGLVFSPGALSISVVALPAGFGFDQTIKINSFTISYV